MKQSFANVLKALCVCTGVLAFAFNASAWGQKGHDVTCAVAQKHLNRKAAKKVAEIFEGKSLVYWSNWLDNASNTPQYKYTKTWHYKNIDADETFENAVQHPDGDVLTAVNSLVESLKSGKLNKEQEAINLRMLIHLVGDMHCPMHMGHKSDLGGNQVQVQYFGRGRNLHGIFDTDIIEGTHKWTYTEWAQEIDTVSKAEAAAIAKGTPAQWAEETYGITCLIYAGTPAGSKLSYDYQYYWTPTIEQQLLRGGLRLAALLNEIYG